MMDQKPNTLGHAGKAFRLISGNGGEFIVVKDYLAAGFIPSVVGHNDKWRTVSRVEDIVFV